MEATFGRTDNSILGNWWWTIDRWIMGSIFALIAIGVFLNFAASPAVAKTIGADMFHFIRKQLMMMPFAIFMIIFMSLQSPKNIKRLAILGFVFFTFLVGITPFFGTEIKGATRWISLFGFSIQPSEFMKPCFAVVSAWLFSYNSGNEKINGNFLSGAVYLLVACLLLLQPDVGMTLVVSIVWATQFFIAGLPIIWVVSLGLLGTAGAVGAYFSFQHVQIRIDRFLHPEAGLSYQVTRSLEAFADGGIFGKGPGEGKIKLHLPDAHTDFIFAVAGEEFGIFLCLFIIILFAIVIIRSFSILLKEKNLFVILAASGLIVQFGLQAIINMASTLHLTPTKGMTLPFISYGGSSLIALAIGTGMLLGLTRKRFGDGDEI